MKDDRHFVHASRRLREKMWHEPLVGFQIRMPQSLISDLESLALPEGRTVANYARKVLTDHVRSKLPETVARRMTLVDSIALDIVSAIGVITESLTDQEREELGAKLLEKFRQSSSIKKKEKSEQQNSGNEAQGSQTTATIKEH